VLYFIKAFLFLSSTEWCSSWKLLISHFSYETFQLFSSAESCMPRKPFRYSVLLSVSVYKHFSSTQFSQFCSVFHFMKIVQLLSSAEICTPWIVEYLSVTTVFMDRILRIALLLVLQRGFERVEDWGLRSCCVWLWGSDGLYYISDVFGLCKFNSAYV